ncbi:MAG: FAD synthetase family protein [Clostridia bacterium]|nr:FAD synthetase family protein [Clostridia bacterium]
MHICLDGHAAAGRSVVALGMFDGLHLGHQVLLKRASALAKRLGATFAAATFITHPMGIIQPEKCPPMLSTFEERVARMEALGVELLCAQPFDQDMMNTPPEVFVARLCECLHPCCIVVGYNHTFGRRREGNPALLADIGTIFGFVVEVVPRLTLAGKEVSSTAVRELLARGMVEEARRMLWRPYGREAVVVEWKNGEYRLSMLNNGKQDVPPGRYRVLVEHGDSSLSGTLRTQRGGRGILVSAGGFSDGMEVRLQFCQRLGVVMGRWENRDRTHAPVS